MTKVYLRMLSILVAQFFISFSCFAHCNSTTAEIISGSYEGSGVFSFQLDFCAGADGTDPAVSGSTGAMRLVSHGAPILTYTASITSPQNGEVFTAGSVVTVGTTYYVEYTNLFGEWFAEPLGPDGTNVCASITFTTLGIPTEVQYLGIETEDDTTIGCYQGRTDLVIPDMGPLPLKLIKFDAVRDNEITLLQWETTDASDLKYFDIEKSYSGLEEDFEVIDKLDAVNSQSTQQYLSEDAHQRFSAYYRLKIIDEDDGVEYSNIIYVELNSEPIQVADIFPNPAISEMYIPIYADNQYDTTFEIYDLTGKFVIQSFTTLEPGYQSPRIKLDRLDKGMYLLRFRINDEVYSKKFVIVN